MLVPVHSLSFAERKHRGQLTTVGSYSCHAISESKPLTISVVVSDLHTTHSPASLGLSRVIGFLTFITIIIVFERKEDGNLQASTIIPIFKFCVVDIRGY